MTVKFREVIPVFRIFDETKAREFYCGFLGFHIDWEHRFAPDAPLYMRVSLPGLVLHLSEHHGDCSPGGYVVVETRGLDDLHAALLAKNYRYNRPTIEDRPWDARTVTVVDPFGNRIMFNEAKT